jgi:hypothetical protein
MSHIVPGDEARPSDGSARPNFFVSNNVTLAVLKCDSYLEHQKGRWL